MRAQALRRPEAARTRSFPTLARAPDGFVVIEGNPQVSSKPQVIRH
jgi:hypothetical protein